MAASLGDLSKDQLVLSMLAVMGGRERDVSERDLFLACWHAFPSAMRWADTALPNPDTFTASLRRLDADGLITRSGKQERGRSKASRRKDVALRVGKSGVVKTQISQDGWERAGVTDEHLDEVRRQAPRPEQYRSIDPSVLIALSAGAREEQGRATDEGALVELAFHTFPARFSYAARPEFPDLDVIRKAIRRAQEARLIDPGYNLTEVGRARVANEDSRLNIRADASTSVRTGGLRLAQRIEASEAFQRFEASGSVAATKADELFRALQLPPTTDSRRIASALRTRTRELRRLDKGEVAEYLVRLAERYHPDALGPIDDES